MIHCCYARRELIHSQPNKKKGNKEKKNSGVSPKRFDQLPMILFNPHQFLPWVFGWFTNGINSDLVQHSIWNRYTRSTVSKNQSPMISISSQQCRGRGRETILSTFQLIGQLVKAVDHIQCTTSSLRIVSRCAVSDFWEWVQRPLTSSEMWYVSVIQTVCFGALAQFLTCHGGAYVNIFMIGH